ncbi:MAG: serine hydrolase [Pseudomonadota bacterium]
MARRWIVRCLPILSGIAGLVLAGMSGASAMPWKRTTPAEAGFDPAIGETLDAAFAAGKFNNLHAVVLVRGGKIVLERYFAGPDQRWGTPLGPVNHSADTKHDLRSISKSVVGLLYGIALAEGKVPLLDASLVAQFPDYPDLAGDAERGRITIADTLSMQLGLKWNEDLPYTDPRNSEVAMERADDRIRYVLEQPILTDPGTRWTYSGGSTALVGHLISRGTGQDLMTYATEKLFRPLGIDDVEWVKGSNGEPAAASGLRMRAPDLARIGQMMLNGGTWQGQRIVPADWLEASFAGDARLEDGLEYGKQWWLGRLRNGERWIGGFGNGGQRLMIYPSLDTTIVLLAGNYDQPNAWRMTLAVLTDVIFPAIRR